MVAAALVLMMLAVVALLTLVVGIWIINEHILANKYRRLVQTAKDNPQPVAAATNGGNQWKITCRVKGKDKTIMVEAMSESLALQKFTKDYQIGYDRIVSINRA